MHDELLGEFGVVAFDHTALAVRAIDAALPLYRDLLGGIQLGAPQPAPARGFSIVALRYPNGGKIELLEPLGDDGFVQRFLERHGEGVHHLTFRVNDIRAAVDRAKAAGLRVVDENFANRRWQEAFISPRSAFGTIVQLAQMERDRPQLDEHLNSFGKLVR
jgi:methylmalonyl-CoA/ethylmalonyl-CoA epimerase